jgi:hypothetical protein
MTPDNIMYRIAVDLTSEATWYQLMKEARAQYGKNWRAQPHTRRRLAKISYKLAFGEQAVTTWFEVPDPGFATLCALKYSVSMRLVPGK